MCDTFDIQPALAMNFLTMALTGLPVSSLHCILNLNAFLTALAAWVALYRGSLLAKAVGTKRLCTGLTTWGLARGRLGMGGGIAVTAGIITKVSGPVCIGCGCEGSATDLG